MPQRIWVRPPVSLTGVAAGGGAAVRAEALAFARVHGAILFDPLQLNAMRWDKIRRFPTCSILSTTHDTENLARVR